MQFRQTHKIPPGYKDAAKDDDGIGDLLIWHTILQVGKERNANVIFVSGEEKADWWHKSEGQVLYPRYELVDEFRRASDEKSFHITSFSQFLNLFGASESIVKEVREEENQIRSEDLLLEVNYDKEPIYFEQVLSNWNKILELIGGVNQNLPALLRMARPLEVKGSELIIGFDYPIFKDKYDSVLNIDQIMSDVVSSVLNVRGMQVKTCN
ncbi:MAG: hypothetical protein IPH82_29115 [Chloroflexi bacterium]|nr:hypothetical protein [Chloroflexota bacterium]